MVLKSRFKFFLWLIARTEKILQEYVTNSTFRRNLVFLQVGFQHQGYMLQTEKPSYKMDSLLG